MIKKIGIIGDGQLAKMLIESASSFYLVNIEFYVLPLNFIEDSPCNGLPVKFVKTYDELFKSCDVVTYEYENINVDSMIESGYETIPSLPCLRTIQNKYLQKKLYEENGFNVPKTYMTGNGINVLDFFHNDALINSKPLYVVKRCVGGYDGKGVHVVNLTEKNWDNDLNQFIKHNVNYFVEEFIFREEVSVIVAINGDECYVYNASYLSMDSDTNVLKMYYTPLPERYQKMEKEIKELALHTVKLYESDGVFAVEMFIDDKNNVYINEVSPRPHNTGHHTIEGCDMSQYDALLRILNKQPFEKEIKEQPVTLYNILGPNFTGRYCINQKLKKTYEEQGFKFNMYNKKINNFNRKMGHVIEFGKHKVVAGFFEQLSNIIMPCEVDIVIGSISDKKTIEPCVDILEQMEIGYNIQVLSAHRMPLEMMEFATHVEDSCTKVIIACAGGAAHLPGMIASMTTLPVIGLPAVSSTLNGLDSLYSIVQMPRGVPVATVAIGNGVNAGLLACRMLAINNKELKKRMKDYMISMNQQAKMSNSQLDHNTSKSS